MRAAVNYPASPAVERGRERLENWGLWSRLDSHGVGYPRKCAYWTPPRTGDIYDEQPESETQPVIDYVDAELVEACVIGMTHVMRRAVKAMYLDRQRKDVVAKRLHTDRHGLERLLVEAETRVGRY